MTRKPLLFFGTIFFCLALASLTAACKGKQAPPPRPPVPVRAAYAARKDMPVNVGAVGNVEAFSTVSVKSQVAGEVLKVYFAEGQDVKKGAPLFLIDPRPLRDALRQAEATLAKDAVQYRNAEIDAGRYKELVDKGYVSRQQYDQARTLADALKGVVETDRAAVSDAKVKLGYASIRSPIEGRTGNLEIHRGNVIKDLDTELVVLNRMMPIKATFSVPEKFLPRIKKYRAEGPLRVRAGIPGDEGPPPEGELTFIDNAVDVTTGTVKLKGEFPNRDKRLWPGQFVNVTLTLTIEQGATVVPSQAVSNGQQGQFVFVIRPDMTAELRPVAVSREYQGLSVVEKGLRPGERVVTDGQVRLVPGAKVTVK